MSKCKFKHFDIKGDVITYTCSDIPVLKEKFRSINNTDEKIKKGTEDPYYNRFCMELDKVSENCRCDKTQTSNSNKKTVLELIKEAKYRRERGEGHWQKKDLDLT